MCSYFYNSIKKSYSLPKAKHLQLAEDNAGVNEMIVSSWARSLLTHENSLPNEALTSKIRTKTSTLGIQVRFLKWKNLLSHGAKINLDSKYYVEPYKICRNIPKV